MESDRRDLLNQILEYHFACIELNLYLDNNPDDEDALCERPSVLRLLGRRGRDAHALSQNASGGRRSERTHHGGNRPLFGGIYGAGAAHNPGRILRRRRAGPAFEQFRGLPA